MNVNDDDNNSSNNNNNNHNSHSVPVNIWMVLALLLQWICKSIIVTAIAILKQQHEKVKVND